jgi:hypothetical protein
MTRSEFASAVTARFGFLADLGFFLVESLPTLVCYRNGDRQIRIYHGRSSYEIGLEFVWGGADYSLLEVIRGADPEAAAQHRNWAATTPESVAEGLTQLEGLLTRFGTRAMQGDAELFRELDISRESAGKEYAFDVLARQIRPRAAEAFQRGDYRAAADLYGEIASRLSPAEAKKFVLAKERS